MGGLIQPSPAAEESPLWRPILIGLVIVVIVVGAIVLGVHESPKTPKGPPPYAADLRISDLKKSASENFACFAVYYLDGDLANLGSKTVAQVVLHVTFRDQLGQVVGDETRPVRILQTGGLYVDTVDLAKSPLEPGQTKPFRLTFEHISTQWNQDFPDITIADVVTK